MAALLAAWLKLGRSVGAFLDATPRLYLLVTEADLARDRAERESILHGAWLGAVLPRLKKIPPFEQLVPQARTVDDDPELRAAEQRAELAALRIVMAEQGRGRSWQEWQERSQS